MAPSVMRLLFPECRDVPRLQHDSLTQLIIDNLRLWKGRVRIRTRSAAADATLLVLDKYFLIMTVANAIYKAMVRRIRRS
jgi:hypothetical protein